MIDVGELKNIVDKLNIYCGGVNENGRLYRFIGSSIIERCGLVRKCVNGGGF